MNADQVIDGIGKAVAANQTQDYCLFWSDYWWWMCMTKAEWAGWAQAIGATVAVFISIFIVNREIKIRNEDKAEERTKELRAIRLILDKWPLERCLSNYVVTFSGMSRHYPNETKYMAEFNCIFIFSHTIESFRKLLGCVRSIPHSDMQALKLSSMGDEIRLILAEIDFLSTRYNVFEDSVKEFDFLKEVTSSSQFFKRIESSRNKVANINEDLIPILEITKDIFVSLNSRHSRLNKSLYGRIS